MKSQERILEHKNKIAGVYSPAEVFGEGGLRYVQTEYPLGGGKPDLILLDKKNRYLVVEIKAGDPTTSQWRQVLPQIEKYKRRISENYGPRVCEKKFRFIYLSDQPLSSNQVSALKARSIECITIPREIVGKEPQSKILTNRAGVATLIRLKPPLVYSFGQGFKKWGTSEQTQGLLEATLSLLEDLFPENHSEVEIKEQGTDLIPKRGRINVVCPLFSFKRFAQIDLLKITVNLKINFKAVENVFTRRRLSEKQLTGYEDFFDVISWQMQSRWTHQYRIQGVEGLEHLRGALNAIRPDIEQVLG